MKRERSAFQDLQSVAGGVILVAKHHLFLASLLFNHFSTGTESSFRS